MTGDGEALRRRLYEPGADRADVDAYLHLAEPEPETEDPGTPPPPVRRERWPWVVAFAVLVAATAVLVTRLLATTPVQPAPLPTRAVDAATAAGFVAALSRGDDAGLAGWWEPGAPYLEEHGDGDGTIELPVSASAGGGRLTVLLVVAKDGVAGWSAARLVIHDDRTVHLRQQAAAVGRVRAGVPAVGRVTYRAEHRPLRLFITAPAGTRWGVAAVFDR